MNGRNSEEGYGNNPLGNISAGQLNQNQPQPVAAEIAKTA
jgi:hypothetical protein